MTQTAKQRKQVAEEAPQTPDVIQITKAVGDQLRANILKVLAQDSFGVIELGDVFEMAQPAMSHHLKILHQAGLVTRRREGTSIFYQRMLPQGSPLLDTIFDELDRLPVPAGINSRIDQIHRARSGRSSEFFATHADALAQQKELICAPAVYVEAVVQNALSDSTIRNIALEVGPGDGTLLRALAPHFASVIGVDNSAEMLATTTAKLASNLNEQKTDGAADTTSIKLIQADFFKLPRIRKYNLVTAAMVVHHMASPAQFFQCAARVLKTNGLLVVAELCAHSHEWVKELCGDLWLGFEPHQLEDWATQSGFTQTQQQFLAQRNGFRVQVNTYQLAQAKTLVHTP